MAAPRCARRSTALSMSGPASRRWMSRRRRSSTFAARPFEYRDPATIPRRKFLYGFELRRRQVSATLPRVRRARRRSRSAAQSAWRPAGTCSVTTSGTARIRCWLWNLEDDLDEVEKTVHAFLKAWEIDASELGDRLYINGADSVGSSGLKLAVEDNFGGFKLQRPCPKR
jgi:hypothetical protein